MGRRSCQSRGRGNELQQKVGLAAENGAVTVVFPSYLALGAAQCSPALALVVIRVSLRGSSQLGKFW